MTALRIATALLLVGFPAATGGSMLQKFARLFIANVLLPMVVYRRCRCAAHTLVKFVQWRWDFCCCVGQNACLSFRGMGRQHA
jgi:hypothetical protein